MGFRPLDGGLIYGVTVVGFHLFQRVVGFRPVDDDYLRERIRDCFHLFQRVVGFRLVTKDTTTRIIMVSFHLFQRVVGFRLRCFNKRSSFCSSRFPSLSESSGFPTEKKQNAPMQAHRCGFHLFQRVVGFRLVSARIMSFPQKECFHLFQRVVGFRHLIFFFFFKGAAIAFPSLSESSGFPTLNEMR